MSIKKDIKKSDNAEIEEIKKLVKEIDPQHSISDREGKFLYNIAKNCKGKGVIVEIGSWKGRSTIWLARGSKAGNKVPVCAIDPHTGSPVHAKMYGKVWTFEEFKKNIRKAGVDDIIIPIIKTSEEAEKSWGNQPIEILWIDGNHEYKFVKLDFDKWSPHLIEGGMIALHDTTFYETEGPKKVVEDDIYKSERFINIGLVNSITFAQKASKIFLRDKLKNKYALLIFELSIALLKFLRKYKEYMPRPVRRLGKKFIKIIRKG